MENIRENKPMKDQKTQKQIWKTCQTFAQYELSLSLSSENTTSSTFTL
jgi:hypothetical protein